MNDTTKKARELTEAMQHYRPAALPDGRMVLAKDDTGNYIKHSDVEAAILAALSEKERAGQMPVAWINPRHLTLIRDGSGFFSNVLRTPNNPGTGTVPLYTAPASGAVPDAVKALPARWRAIPSREPGSKFAGWFAAQLEAAMLAASKGGA